MKATVITRYGNPEVLRVQDVPDPTAGPKEELVRVQAGGLNFADTMTAKGGYPGTPKPPLVVGREFCGTRVSTGDRVMGYTQWGAFAETVAARSVLLWPVPASRLLSHVAQPFAAMFFWRYLPHRRSGAKKSNYASDSLVVKLL